MADSLEYNQAELVERLSSGFAALLQQVDDLKRHSEAMEKFLRHEQKIPSAYTEDEEKAQGLAISDGIEAFTALKRRDGITIHCKGSTDADVTHKQIAMPKDHPTVEHKGSKKLSCPFASLAKEQPTEQQQPFEPPSPTSQRPNSLPTPPDTAGEHPIDDTGIDLNQNPQALPPAPQSPPSVTASLSKCPIRLLDERPPEEIAEYFESHKHEIPRSHEVCVKRYQSNEQSIKQLDAKYGSLVNMIQGLGMKHQPLLPHKDEGPEAVEEKRKEHLGSGKVQEWVGYVRAASAEGGSEVRVGSDRVAEREGRFDRPLKEIRVGESPSRPWGISVPVGTAPAVEDILSGRTRSESKPKSMEAQPASIDLEALKDAGVDSAKNAAPNVVFNGPIFIGYPPEQAASFLKQIGARK